MEPDVPHEHVVVSIEDGDNRTEEVCVLVVGEGTYRVLVPPLWTTGLAAGDEFRIDPETARPVVVRRSGNLLVWLYPEDVRQEEIAAVATEVEALGGAYEGGGHHGRVCVFTVPVGATFPVVEAIFNRFVTAHPNAQWLFGNVYAADGRTPLYWWSPTRG